ncbi:MAG TPA: glycosyltransferase family protein [Bacteroidia bacterium]|nr:glycosyltransferase family protein [Bacteroidia bacterium]
MNILYGVPGEGMGHATRSKVIIDHLIKKKHQLCIVSSGRAFGFLNNEFPGLVIEIKGFHFAYKNAEVSKTKTFLSNLQSSAKNLGYNTAKKLLIEKSFTPDLVISDFESFTFFFAKEHRLPLVSIDNMQVMDRCELELSIPKAEKNNYLLARNIVKAKVPGCDHYFVSSFFEAGIKKKNTTLVPPIIRQAIQDAVVTQKDHIIMYQTSSSLKIVKDILQQLPQEKFFVYGMNLDRREGNVTYKPFSEAGFIADLAASKAVIANGGFSFISEAVYLKKPVYAFPIHNQFEQWMNAAYIEKTGYGRHFDSLNADSLKAFVYDLPVFKARLAEYKQSGNRVLFEQLDNLLAGY